MNYVLEIMDFVFKMMNCFFKMTNLQQRLRMMVGEQC